VKKLAETLKIPSIGIQTQCAEPSKTRHSSSLLTVVLGTSTGPDKIFRERAHDDLKTFVESADCSDGESDDEDGLARGNRFNAERTNIRYKNLVDLVRVQFFREFSLATVPAWFQRIACWCDRNGISLRTPNRTIPRNPLKVAREVYRCVSEVAEVLEGLKDLLPCEICNFDETAIQIFALWINISDLHEEVVPLMLFCHSKNYSRDSLMRTLHWKGANAVPRNKRDACKLCLSCGIAWFADGSITAASK